MQVIESQDDGGFLKLSRTQEWILGEESEPMNKKVIAKVWLSRQSFWSLMTKTSSWALLTCVYHNAGYAKW